MGATVIPGCTEAGKQQLIVEWLSRSVTQGKKNTKKQGKISRINLEGIRKKSVNERG